MAISVITKKAREKMALARSTTGTIPKIKWIALGDGGVDAEGNLIIPLASNTELHNEVIRKEYSNCTKVSDTAYEYAINLEVDELVGTYISEMALIDEDGDIVAISNFLAKGKDDTEDTFSIEDNY